MLDFGKKVLRQGLALPITLIRQPDQPGATARFADHHSLLPQQSLDPVHVRRPLLHQAVALPADSPSILLLLRRNMDDPHPLRLAPKVRHQCAQQDFAVNPVRLRPPVPLLNRYARRIKDVVLHPRRQEQPVQPKAVVARLVAASPPSDESQPAATSRPQIRSINARRPTWSPPATVCREILSRSGLCLFAGQPSALAQFNRNENRAIMPCGGRAPLDACISSLLWFECANPNLTRRGTLSHHGIY